MLTQDSPFQYQQCYVEIVLKTYTFDNKTFWYQYTIVYFLLPMLCWQSVIIRMHTYKYNSIQSRVCECCISIISKLWGGLCVCVSIELFIINTIFVPIKWTHKDAAISIASFYRLLSFHKWDSVGRHAAYWTCLFPSPISSEWSTSW